MTKAISIQSALGSFKFLSNRSPETTVEEAKDAFSKLAEYRDGKIYYYH